MKGFVKFLIIFVPFMALIVAWLSYGERGFVQLSRMEEERQSSLEKIRVLERENQRLMEEIERLRTDKDYIESVARRELGLVKENEVIYKFSKKEGDLPEAEKGKETPSGPLDPREIPEEKGSGDGKRQ